MKSACSARSCAALLHNLAGLFLTCRVALAICSLPDELIRQVTIESPERGLLLMRVRDEVRMTISAYQTLYQSSITFGMRKTLQAEQGNSELIKRVNRTRNHDNHPLTLEHES
jgi:hypothetical protein